ncbi:unnamed protein product [Musa acuminata subsp. malaccensis]|uniref:Chalcone--flavanone isomerase n=1 Tax=Musa acuminata subsp. malaccensis TaxID=214687 RepID=A0A804I5W9_MUSAM|nr:PREDICTED: fatty-acid-binding protein 1-like [Musa acuminata subsp. malaccensis]CAG1862877.1 unnamed protein product [Musa acuminata subsp. malaccensis]
MQAEVGRKEEEEEEEKMEVEPKTGVSFPAKLPDGKQLCATGLRRRKLLAFGINFYAFGMYVHIDARLKELLKAKLGEAAEKPCKELYEAVIDGDVGIAVRLVIVFKGLTMSMVRKSFDEGLVGSLKKLTGGQKNEELIKKVMAAAKDGTKLPPGSVIEITRLPGQVLQAMVKDELVSKVESELLCRAYFHLYLGDDPFDKEAKERFGRTLVSSLSAP